MTDELLPYYHNELSFLRRLGNEFAEAHPKIAGRLRLTEDASDDPHVAQLDRSLCVSYQRGACQARRRFS